MTHLIDIPGVGPCHAEWSYETGATCSVVVPVDSHGEIPELDADWIAREVRRFDATMRIGSIPLLNDLKPVEDGPFGGNLEIAGDDGFPRHGRVLGRWRANDDTPLSLGTPIIVAALMDSGADERLHWALIAEGMPDGTLFDGLTPADTLTAHFTQHLTRDPEDIQVELALTAPDEMARAAHRWDVAQFDEWLETLAQTAEHIPYTGVAKRIKNLHNGYRASISVGAIDLWDEVKNRPRTPAVLIHSYYRRLHEELPELLAAEGLHVVEPLFAPGQRESARRWEIDNSVIAVRQPELFQSEAARRWAADTLCRGLSGVDRVA